MKTTHAYLVVLVSCMVCTMMWEVSALAQAKEKKTKEKNMLLQFTISYSKRVVDLDERVEFTAELKNISDKPITIVFRGSNGLLDYLTYYSRKPGEDWGEGQRANVHLSDLGLCRIPQVLAPGKAIIIKNPPARQFPSEFQPKPGVYQLKGVFEYQDPDDPKAPVLRAESNIAEIELRPSKK